MSGGILEGKVVLITGAGPDLGRAAALLMAKEGAKVAVAARNLDRVQSIADEIREHHGDSLALPIDLVSDESCQDTVSAVVQRWGRIDIVVQNGFDLGQQGPAKAAIIDRWKQAMDCNFFGAVRVFTAALPHMREVGGGNFIFINSGVANSIPQEGLGSYAASKAALASLVQTVALECGKYGIRCNGVHFGPIDGETTRGWMGQCAENEGVSMAEYEKSYVARRFPLGFMPTADDCAGSILMLASDFSRAITGQAVSVNAGMWFGR